MAVLIFDYDGTLHDSVHVFVPGFRSGYQALVDAKTLEDKHLADQDISKWLGLSVKDMWDEVAPDLSQEDKIKFMITMDTEMRGRIRNKEARLYPGTKDILKRLHDKGHQIVLLSNCPGSLMQLHRECLELDDYFDDFYASGDYNNMPKPLIFLEIQKKYRGTYIVIGDRFKDMEVADTYGLLSIGCGYGYGQPEEIENASIVISDISELEEAIEKLL